MSVDHGVTSPRGVVDIAELHEPVPSRVQADARFEVARDDRTGSIHLIVNRHERAGHRHEAGRVHRPPGIGVRLPITDLRHEPGIGAEPAADVVVLRLPVQVPRVVRPGGLKGAARESLAVPLRGEVRPVWRSRIAVQPLPGDDIGADGRHWKSGPTTRLCDPALGGFTIGNHHARQTTGRCRAWRGPGIPSTRNSCGAVDDSFGPGRMTLPPPESSVTSAV